MAFATTLHLLHARAEWLVLVLAVAFMVGEFMSRLIHFNALIMRGHAAVARFGRKLDRKNRGIATLVYRGIVALTLLLIPAIVTGIILSRPSELLQGFTTLLLVMIFGCSFATISGITLWRRAKAEHTPLELPPHDFLFPDGHAVLRYAIESRAEAFEVGIVGASFWYVLAGLPAMFAYLTIASAAASYRGSAFGWAARSLFMLVDFPSRCISRLLFLFASLFTPNTKPLAALTTRGWREFIAQLLGVTLGGPSPTGTRPWAGNGTARPTHVQLRGALMLNTIATLLLLLLLASQKSYKLLISSI